MHWKNKYSNKAGEVVCNGKECTGCWNLRRKESKDSGVDISQQDVIASNMDPKKKEAFCARRRRRVRGEDKWSREPAVSITTTAEKANLKRHFREGEFEPLDEFLEGECPGMKFADVDQMRFYAEVVLGLKPFVGDTGEWGVVRWKSSKRRYKVQDRHTHNNNNTNNNNNKNNTTHTYSEKKRSAEAWPPEESSVRRRRCPPKSRAFGGGVAPRRARGSHLVGVEGVAGGAGLG